MLAIFILTHSKALDLQFNSITDAGARSFDLLLQKYKDIMVIDVRNNRVGDVLLKLISKSLSNNSMSHEVAEFEWLDDKDPLKLSYYFYPSMHHHRHQTISSVNKRKFAVQRSFKIPIASDNTSKSRSNTPATRIPSRKPAKVYATTLTTIDKRVSIASPEVALEEAKIAVVPKIEWIYEPDESLQEEAILAAIARAEPINTSVTRGSSGKRSSRQSGSMDQVPSEISSRKSKIGGLSSDAEAEYADVSVGPMSYAADKKKAFVVKTDELDQRHYSVTEGQKSVESIQHNDDGSDIAEIENTVHGKLAASIGRPDKILDDAQDDGPGQRRRELQRSSSMLNDAAQVISETQSKVAGGEGLGSELASLLDIFSESMGAFDTLLSKYESDKERRRIKRREARRKKATEDPLLVK